MRSYAYKKGLAGEDRAVCYLQKKGYRILSRNYRFHRYEIDIIARHGDTVVFIEVKARRSEDFGVPELAVDFRKQKHIILVARKFLSANNLFEACYVRFDVIAIDSHDHLRHIVSAFDAGKQ